MFYDVETVEDEQYKAFVEKFKPKKTTDDCYTPDVIYDAVACYVAQHYGLDRACFVRPFWPGGDFERYPYRPEDVVVDNPPFSILARIVEWYNRRGVRYFLFAPSLTGMGTVGRDGMGAMLNTNAYVTYENGACVNTSFMTNLEPEDMLCRTCPELNALLKKANEAYTRTKTRKMPEYRYPTAVLMANNMNYMAAHGVHFEVRRREAVYVRELDSQKKQGKSIFGGGFLLSRQKTAEKAAAEKAAATVWALSEREQAMIDKLGNGG